MLLSASVVFYLQALRNEFQCITFAKIFENEMMGLLRVQDLN